MSSRQERAARRRARWEAEVVVPGQPKGPLYATLSPEQRLLALVRLNELAWRAAGGRSPEPLPRHRWPGHIFELHHRE